MSYELRLTMSHDCLYQNLEKLDWITVGFYQQISTGVNTQFSLAVVQNNISRVEILLSIIVYDGHLRLKIALKDCVESTKIGY